MQVSFQEKKKGKKKGKKEKETRTRLWDSKAFQIVSL